MNELTKRILSGVLLAVVLLGDLWLGEWWYVALLVIGAVLTFREYMRLVLRGWTGSARLAWTLFGVAYIGAAVYGLWFARQQGFVAALFVFLLVWATDIGAYAFGRTIGGPKIAPSISPSKTWAGYVGAVIVTTLVAYSAVSIQAYVEAGVYSFPWDWGLIICLWAALVCAIIAAVAQAGDFFESWMKRRAGMKDSGTLIPGHGGLFDRIDGLLPVAALFPLYQFTDFAS